MILEINTLSDTPIYKQIRDQIILGIATLDLKPNEAIPTVRQLADEIGVNMMTVSKAYRLLKEEGYIVTDRRKGTFVSQNHSNDETFKKLYENQLNLLLAEAFIHDMTYQDLTADIKMMFSQFRKEDSSCHL